jgi:hypothetical protein
MKPLEVRDRVIALLVGGPLALVVAVVGLSLGARRGQIPLLIAPVWAVAFGFALYRRNMKRNGGSQD